MSHVPKSAEFSLSPSRYTLYAELGFTAVVGLVVATAPILLWAKAGGLLFLLVVGYGFYHRFRQQYPVRLFVLDSKTDSWRLILEVKRKKGQGSREVKVDLQLMPSQFVTAYLVILYFKSLQDFKSLQGAKLIRVIPRDSLSGEEHRLLRKLLIARTACSKS